MTKPSKKIAEDGETESLLGPNGPSQGGTRYHVELPKLPSSWKYVNFAKLLDIQGGSQPPKSTFVYEPTPGYIQLLQIRDFGERGVPTFVREDSVTKRCSPDDVLVARYGASLGRILTGEAGAYNVALAKVIFDKTQFHGRYLFYLLQTPFFQTPIHMISRSAQNGFNKGDLSDILLPVAPLPEQLQIVAEIEKQFTRLDAGVAALRRVQANLKRYRAAVLKAACEGRLVPTEAELVGRVPTPGVPIPQSHPRGASGTGSAGSQHHGDAGSQHRNRAVRESGLGNPAYRESGFETGAQLLARILAERRKNWKGRGAYKEPAAPDTETLPQLPESWSWVSWEMILAHKEGAFKRGPFGSALTKAIFVEKGFKVYEQYCPINDDCTFARYYITPEKFEEFQAFEVEGGDYLISCSGVTLGRITRVPETFERGIINQALLRVRINDSVINHRYFLHLFRSALFQKAIFDNSTGSAIPNVKGVKELKAMAIPLPPFAEQTRIVAEVERRLSVVEELETVVSANLQRAARLRQSILQKAFAGELLAD